MLLNVLKLAVAKRDKIGTASGEIKALLSYPAVSIVKTTDECTQDENMATRFESIAAGCDAYALYVLHAETKGTTRCTATS